jgi:hypothetical protein
MIDAARMRQFKPIRGGRRTAWIGLSLAVALLLTAYAFVAIVAQPLTGAEEVADRGLATLAGNPGDSTEYRLFDYADGGTFTVTRWLSNSGPVGLTITGVDVAPDYWVGLIGVKDARQAVPVVPGKCCAIDEAATWTAPGFRPLHLNPGQWGGVSVRYLMSHCEDSGPGGTLSFAAVGIRYNILGYPRDVQIPWSAPIAVTSPETCPRTGPARPSAAIVRPVA